MIPGDASCVDQPCNVSSRRRDGARRTPNHSLHLPGADGPCYDEGDNVVAAEEYV